MSIIIVALVALGLTTATVLFTRTTPIASAPIVISGRTIQPLPPITVKQSKVITKVVNVNYVIHKVVVVKKSGEGEHESEID